MLITHKHINKKFEYNGSQIEPIWAFNEFKIKGSSIITWRGSMDIKVDNLKDFADLGLEIKSDDALHCIVEFFDCQPTNMRIAYLRQRLLVLIFEEELIKNGVNVYREGDDIYIGSSKLTVSIASASISSIKIHFAFNLRNEGTPDDVKTIGLFEIKDKNGQFIFNDSNLMDFVNNIINNYILEIETIEMDISKTKLL